MLTFLLPLLSGAAFAAEPTNVLVSSFQSRNSESAELAGLIEGYVAAALAKRDDLKVFRIEDTPDFEEYSARIFMRSCPVGEAVGCTFIVGERAEAAWGVTGSVQTVMSGTRVDVDVVDIANSRVALSFRTDLEEGRDEEFAQAVARVVIATIAGEMGKEEDIRDVPETEDPNAEKASDAAVAAELAKLEAEMGGFDMSVRRSNVSFERPKMTAEDIIEKSQGEGTKPWERLGMSASDYLLYKNSGLDLPTFRVRKEGKKFQLIVRAGGGFMNGPVNGEYIGRYALDQTTLVPVDAYVAQAVQSGATAVGGASVGFGVHPAVDVSVQIGVAGGEFTYLINDEVVGQVDVSPDPTLTQNQSILVGPRVTVSLFPTRNLRPTFGAGGYWMQGTGIDDHIQVPDALASYGAESLWNVEVFGGGEVRMGDAIDLYLQVPVSFLVAGELIKEERGGSVQALDGLKTPSIANAVGVSVVAGIQVRLFGSKPQEATLLDDEDEAP